jgi:flagellar hook-basal body complex protein FliE
MVVNAADVLSVYKKTGGIIDQASSDNALSSGGGASFADTLKSFAGDTVSTLKEGEQAAIDHATGKTDINGVVTSINNAEVVLEEVVALRDKVIAAYQSITSSAI